MSRHGLSITLDIREPIESISILGSYAISETIDKREVYIDDKRTSKKVEQIILRLLDDNANLWLNYENSGDSCVRCD